MQNKKLLVVGLTGQTGAGKTLVSKLFKNKGFTVINADEISRIIINSETILNKLVSVFGNEILNDDASLNRKILAAKTFPNPEELQKLNEIMYPPILAEIEERIKNLQESGIKKILLDAPTLFESKAQRLCNVKISVLANKELRRERIMKRDSLTLLEAENRMSAQQNDRFYILRSDYIIHNNTSEEELKKQAELIIKHLSGGISKDKKERSPVANLFLWAVIVLSTILLIKGSCTLILKAIYPQKYESIISSCAEEYNIDENLIYAVIKCESGFDKNAVSKADAKGLMQITEETFEWINSKMGKDVSYDDIFSPEINIRYGSCLISLLLEEFTSEENAIIAYHAGWGNVKKWLSDDRYSSDGITIETIPFPTTDNYLENVLKAKSVYEKLYS